MNIEAAITILVVDDDAFVLETTSLLLKEQGFRVVTCIHANDALSKFKEDNFDIVLTDIKMPDMSGIELLEKIHAVNREVPVILMTAYAELNAAVEAVKKGAFDFLIKPYETDYLTRTIQRAVKYYRLIQMEKNYKIRLEEDVKRRTKELADALTLLKDINIELTHRLTVASEYRDTDTGVHIKRIGLYSSKIAEVLNLSFDFVEAITLASPMHDIGKIGIPDSILLKPASLSPEEFAIMKTHTTMGEKIFLGSQYPVIRMAAAIALNHHERWDGSGYPMGLKGALIPVEARITMLCDQYDAMRSRRPYKEPFSHEKTYKILTEGDNRTKPQHLDAKVLKAFIDVAPQFDEIFKEHQD